MKSSFGALGRIYRHRYSHNFLDAIWERKLASRGIAGDIGGQTQKYYSPPHPSRCRGHIRNLGEREGAEENPRAEGVPRRGPDRCGSAFAMAWPPSRQQRVKCPRCWSIEHEPDLATTAFGHQDGLACKRAAFESCPPARRARRAPRERPRALWPLRPSQEPRTRTGPETPS